MSQNNGEISWSVIEWSIRNFEQRMNLNSRQCLKSKTNRILFQNEFYIDWYLKMWPNAESPKDEGYISLYLYTDVAVSPIPPVDLEASFYIVNQQGVKPICSKSESLQGVCESRVGFDRFLKHSSISMSSTDKIFTVICKMSYIAGIGGARGIEESSESKAAVKFETSEINRLSLDMISLFESGEYSDCIIVCGVKEFNCHKAVLTGRSPVFKAMFTGDMVENRSSKVVIKDFDEDTVIELIHYIYSGNARNLDRKAVDLLAAADKYDLNELRDICETHLCNEISMTNVCDMLIIAHLHESTMLQNTALQFVSDNGKKILDQVGWKDKLMAYPEILARMFEASIRH